jgi:hypothetical protein
VALQELLAEAAAKGAEATKLADGLRSRIATAEAWEQRAHDFFSGEQRQPLQTLKVRAAVARCLSAARDCCLCFVVTSVACTAKAAFLVPSLAWTCSHTCSTSCSCLRKPQEVVIRSK